VPDCVQKSLPLPAPFGLPGQHAAVLEPHVLVPVHRLLLQKPSDPPQLLPVPIQRPPTQQRPWLHELRSQHAWLVLPQLAIEPFVQTVPAFGPSPLARQLPLLQHPPPEHVLPVQHVWPGAPHPRHVPAVQRLPALHMLPVQHGWLVPPHAAHVAPVQMLPALQALPVQQACVAPPQTTQLAPLHTAPALHMLPAQHGDPTTPHTPASRTP
jgi:hypothetical protein